MARRRFLVALVPPAALLEQLRALRSLVGGPDRERIAPHVTLVPPFNLHVERVGDLRQLLREAAADARPIPLQLGPAASFAPLNPTLHLSVGGDEQAVAALRGLRERLRSGPMDRTDRHEFVPHLTLRRDAPQAITDAAAEVLAGHLAWEVDRLHLFEQVHHGGHTVWTPVAEEPFGGPVVVGRGGIEVHLRTVGDDEPHRLLVVAEAPRSAGLVIARADGAVGAGLARLETLEVVEDQRGLGIGRQVLARWCTDAARRGATVAVAEAPPTDPALIRTLEPFGFTVIGRVAVRELPRSSDG